MAADKDNGLRFPVGVSGERGHRNPPGWWNDQLPPNAVALYPGQHSRLTASEPTRSPEMLIIMALLSALEKRQGFRTIKTKTFYALPPA